MNQQQKGECDANQIKQANDHPRGTVGGRVHPSAYVIDRDGQWWRICGGDQHVSTARGVDTPTPQNESDAVWGERNG